MQISPCPADRARALARLKRGRAERVRRSSEHALEVKMGCGCVMVVDFNEPGLAAALERLLKNRLKELSKN